MKVISLEETAVTLPEAAEMAKGDLVILMRKGKPLAAIKRLSASDWEALAVSRNPKFQALIAEARASYQEEGGVRLEELRQELDLPRKSKKQPRKKKTLRKVSNTDETADS
jgi:hypothetical protein